jgi:hypothetical protein
MNLVLLVFVAFSGQRIDREFPSGNISYNHHRINNIRSITVMAL